MGTTKLKITFKQVYCCTITEYIQQRRLSQGENLLCSTDFPIEQIALAVGYSNAGRFSRDFKKVLVYILLNIGSGHSKKINKKRYNKSFCLEKFLYKLLKYHLLSLVLSRAEGKYFDIFENPLAFST